MTTITDTPTPRIDEPRVVRSKTYVTPAVVILLVAGTLTFLNLAAAVYTFRATSNLSAIEDRLGELKAFEDRVAGQLDRMNSGIQARLEMLQSDFRGEIGGLRDQTNRLATTPLISDQDTAAIETEAPEAEVEVMSEPVPVLEQDPVVEQQEAVADDPVTPPKRPARVSAAETPPAYQRIQSEDGKVYYRKVQ